MRNAVIYFSCLLRNSFHSSFITSPSSCARHFYWSRLDCSRSEIIRSGHSRKRRSLSARVHFKRLTLAVSRKSVSCLIVLPCTYCVTGFTSRVWRKVHSKRKLKTYTVQNLIDILWARLRVHYSCTVQRTAETQNRAPRANIYIVITGDNGQ